MTNAVIVVSDSQHSRIVQTSRALAAIRGQFRANTAGQALVKLVRTMVLLALTFPTYRRFSELAKRREFDRLCEKQPLFQFKYLKRNCLARNLTLEARANSLLHHYKFLLDRFNPSFIAQLQFQRISLWERQVGTKRYGVDLTLSNMPSEGELSLLFRVGTSDVFTLSFTFVDGTDFGEQGDPTVLISRLQGAKGQFELIRTATKDLNQSAPQTILFFILETIAKSIGIRRIVSVNAANHPGASAPMSRELAQHFVQAYDGFLTELGGIQLGTGFIGVSVPYSEKALRDVVRSHRRRTVVKRRFRKEICNEAGACFLKQSGYRP